MASSNASSSDRCNAINARSTAQTDSQLRPEPPPPQTLTNKPTPTTALTPSTPAPTPPHHQPQTPPKAYERVLEDHPEFVGQAVLIQITNEPRSSGKELVELHDCVRAVVARINARFGSPGARISRALLGFRGPGDRADAEGFALHITRAMHGETDTMRAQCTPKSPHRRPPRLRARALPGAPRAAPRAHRVLQRRGLRRRHRHARWDEPRALRIRGLQVGAPLVSCFVGGGGGVEGGVGGTLLTGSRIMRVAVTIHALVRGWGAAQTSKVGAQVRVKAGSPAPAFQTSSPHPQPQHPNPLPHIHTS